MYFGIALWQIQTFKYKVCIHLSFILERCVNVMTFLEELNNEVHVLEVLIIFVMSPLF